MKMLVYTVKHAFFFFLPSWGRRYYRGTVELRALYVVVKLFVTA